MNKRRLLKLATFLRTVPRRAFDIQNWQTRPATKPEGRVPGECGFAGCAMGWAAHAKLFRDLKPGQHGWPVFRKNGKGQSFSQFDAAKKLFELSSYNSAYYLFDPVRYAGSATPLQVTKRIEEFVRNNEDLV